ncbi:MAG: DUF2917 domain-containing protein [Burkholderiales bacterium]|nr:DUF2917 domain-containing protein [Burkholderiales bacterium]
MTRTSEARDFFTQRLHSLHHPRPRFALRRPERVTRRVCLKLARGATEVIPDVDGSIVVRCARGSVWITHDGDPKDVILQPQQTYQAERDDPMRMHALQACVLEIQFEDEAAGAG